jgi:hypothetical protein
MWLRYRIDSPGDEYEQEIIGWDCFDEQTTAESCNEWKTNDGYRCMPNTRNKGDLYWSRPVTSGDMGWSWKTTVHYQRHFKEIRVHYANHSDISSLLIV